ncbi:MAG: hypothetical protein JO149_09120 [Gammaproteobacteria bacterium]|nr:hypothetical protein [Gammaproteobacteria bacterium]
MLSGSYNYLCSFFTKNTTATETTGPARPLNASGSITLKQDSAEPPIVLVHSNEITITDNYATEPQKKQPLKHCAYKLYEKLAGDVLPTFHDVFKVLKRKLGKDPVLYFYKRNKFQHASTTPSYMYELEATCVGWFRKLARHLMPASHVVVNENNVPIGIVSKAIEGFKSVMDKPLKKKHLEIPALNYFSAPELDAIDRAIKLSGLDISPLDKKQELFSKEIEGKTVSVTVGDLKNFRTIKDLALCLVLCYFFAEDDLHRGNLSIYPEVKKIDGDMTCWYMLYYFKETGIIDWTFRHPKDRFKLSAEDIRTFPILKIAAPFYWVASAAPVIPENILNWLSTIFPVSKNPFPSEEYLIYHELVNHPVFEYFKFSALLQCSLTTEEMYRSVAHQHLRKNIPMPAHYDMEAKKALLETFVEKQTERTKELSLILEAMPEFNDFMTQHGDKVFENILQYYTEENKYYEKKAEKEPDYKYQIVDLEQMKLDFAKVKESIEKKSVKVIDENEINAMLSTSFVK